MLPSPQSSADQPLALFLDFDGTLVELAERPDQIVVPDSLLEVLETLHARLQGALAIVSGRRLTDLLRHLAPLAVPAAGNHGLEYQLQPGQAESLVDASFPEAARASIESLVAPNPGLIAEAKGQSMAVHYRLAPELAAMVATRIGQIRDKHAPDFILQPGKMVWEMRPPGANKGTAIRNFMKHEPFAGRLPVFVGDDLTDECGFRAVDDMDGWSIHVGPGNGATEARMRLSNVAAVAQWLKELGSKLPGHCA